MARNSSANPTEIELAILRILWEHGPCTVRDVHEALDRDRPTGYTTTLKQLQIMTEKGLVRRDESQRSHVYQARLGEDQAQKKLMRSLLKHAFGGSAQKLIMHALNAAPASHEELSKIKQLLENMEGEHK